MQEKNPSPFSNRPPLPTPDGNVFAPEPTLLPQRGDWKSAPGIVRGWAYVVTWLNIIVTPLLAVVSLVDEKTDAIEKGIFVFVLALVWIFAIWLNRALKKGTPAGWTGQIIFSILGLLSFPIGTAIHGYILSQWFKPETKAWFGKS